MATKTSGAHLHSKEATFGTVRLNVDHAEEHYEILTSSTIQLADWLEIADYLTAHDFEIMDPDECPPEPMPGGGYRYWACHIEGMQFGYITAGHAMLVACGAILVPALPILNHLTNIFGELAA